MFTKAVLDDARTIFASVCADFGAELIEMDGEDDHVHLLVTYPPKVAVSTLVNSLKGVSSRRLRQNHPALVRRYWKGVLWSPSARASSGGGAPSSIIRRSIEHRHRATAHPRLNLMSARTRICAYLRPERRSLRR